MDRMPAIKSVMTAFPHSVDDGESMERAAAMMGEHGIRHLPVMRDGLLVGVMGERELELAYRAGLAGPDGVGLKVRDLTTDHACVVDLDEPLDNVLLRMVEERHDCALVLRQGKLAGIFTVTDACRGYAHLLRSGRPRHGDDAA